MHMRLATSQCSNFAYVSKIEESVTLLITNTEMAVKSAINTALCHNSELRSRVATIH